MTTLMLCVWCNTRQPAAGITDHIRDHHPDRWAAADGDWWPDGDIAVIDVALTPDTFTRRQ